MPPVAVVTDSTADLPAEVVQAWPITVVPLWLHWEGRDYRDGVDLTPEAFYQRLGMTARLPTTSHPPPEAIAEVFRTLAYSGHDIYAVFLSDKFSGTYRAALQARQQVPGARIIVEDSGTTSMAQGFQVLAAAQAAQAGASLEEVQAAAHQARAHSGQLFVPRTLAYMRRSGRLGPLQYRLASALQILPVLEIRDGGPALVTRVRTYRRAVEYMVDEIVQRLAGKPQVRLAFMHADAPTTIAGVEAAVLAHITPVEVIRGTLGPVLGLYTGPGLVGVAYWWG